MPEEYLDLVNENDEVIGRKKRSDIYTEGLSNYRAINLFIVNSKGEMWIPRRTANKNIFPLCLDMSMGGHVKSGETYEEGLKREIEEELNIDIDQTPSETLGHLTPKKDGVSCYMNVYKIITNNTPDYNKEDFIESFWLKPEEILRLIDEGEKAKDDLPRIIRKFFI
jgi:isopentenyldiphosphate isomerase